MTDGAHVNEEFHEPAMMMGVQQHPAVLREARVMGAGLVAASREAYEAGDRTPAALVRLHFHLESEDQAEPDCCLGVLLALDVEDIADLGSALMVAGDSLVYLAQHVDHPERTGREAMYEFIAGRIALRGALAAAQDGQTPASPADL